MRAPSWPSPRRWTRPPSIRSLSHGVADLRQRRRARQAMGAGLRHRRQSRPCLRAGHRHPRAGPEGARSLYQPRLGGGHDRAEAARPAAGCGDDVPPLYAGRRSAGQPGQGRILGGPRRAGWRAMRPTPPRISPPRPSMWTNITASSRPSGSAGRSWCRPTRPARHRARDARRLRQSRGGARRAAARPAAGLAQPDPIHPQDRGRRGQRHRSRAGADLSRSRSSARTWA